MLEYFQYALKIGDQSVIVSCTYDDVVHYNLGIEAFQPEGFCFGVPFLFEFCYQGHKNRVGVGCSHWHSGESFLSSWGEECQLCFGVWFAGYLPVPGIQIHSNEA